MTPPPTPPPAPESGRRPRRRRLVVGVVVLAVLALGATLALTRPSDQPARADGPASSEKQEGERRADPGTSATATATPSPTSPAPERGDGASQGGTGARTSPAAPPPAPPDDERAGSTTAPPADVGADVVLQPGLVATVTAVDAVRVEPRGPGDIAGPGAAVRVELSNSTREVVDLAGLSVTATSQDGAPAIPSDDRAAQPLTGRLLAGAQRSGTYVFRVADSDGPLRISLSVNTSSQIAVVIG